MPAPGPPITIRARPAKAPPLKVARPAKRPRSRNARRFGEVLVIDHLAVDLFVEAGGRAERLLATLAIDLATGAVVGGVLNMGAPRPAHVADVLQAARLRTEALKGKAERPRLSLNATFASEWTGLISRLTGAGLPTAVTRTSRLQLGAPGQRLLGGRLGRLKLVPRNGHRADLGASEFDPSRNHAVTIDEARRVLDADLSADGADRSHDGWHPLLIEI